MGQIELDGSNSTLQADIIRGQTGTTVKLGGLLDTDGNYIQTEKGGDIASASPLVIDTDGDYFDVTGTVSFAAMTVAADRQFTLQFDGILTMTHHATNLDLPGEANITTAAGDVATFQSTGSNTVQCINYTRADGTPIVSSSHTPEGTAVLSTGEAGGTKYLREDGDGTSSWQTAGGGNKTIYIPSRAAADSRDNKNSMFHSIIMNDAATHNAYGMWHTPDDFSSLTSVTTVVKANGTGNIYAGFEGGAGATGDIISTDNDSIAVTTYAATATQFLFIDVTAAFNGLTIGANHIIAFEMERQGADANDTIGGGVSNLGWIVVYA